MDFALSDDQRAFQDAARAFARHELAPHTADWDAESIFPREVIARVQALLRRAQGRTMARAQAWEVDESGLRIAWRGQWLSLTPLEFRMLRQMLSHPGRVFSRQQLLDSAHNDQREVSDRAIDTHVKNIRRKLQVVNPADDCISPVYGVGHRFEAPAP